MTGRKYFFFYCQKIYSMFFLNQIYSLSKIFIKSLQLVFSQDHRYQATNTWKPITNVPQDSIWWAQQTDCYAEIVNGWGSYQSARSKRILKVRASTLPATTFAKKSMADRCVPVTKVSGWRMINVWVSLHTIRTSILASNII